MRRAGAGGQDELTGYEHSKNIAESFMATILDAAHFHTSRLSGRCEIESALGRVSWELVESQ